MKATLQLPNNITIFLEGEESDISTILGLVANGKLTAEITKE